MKPLPATIFRSTRESSNLANAANTLLVAALICGFLYFGSEVLIPIALAILITFLLAPAVKALQRLRLPKSLAVAIIVLIVFSLLGGLSYVIGREATKLAADLPGYETNLRQKIQSIRTLTAANGTFGRAGELLSELGQELEPPQSGTKDNPAISPMPVTIVSTQTGLFATYAGWLETLLHPLVQSLIMVIFVVFFLIQREDLRNRTIRLAGRGDLLKSTAALNDAAGKLSRLFVAQALVNGSFGVFIGASLWLLGVPSAVLWGVFTATLRFIPYVGALLSAVFPILIAFAVSPDWTLPLMVVALFLVSESIVGQVIEPLAFGHMSGLSPVAVIAAAAFWTAIWGPVGLVLSTPLTICLVILGRHVEGMAFLEVLFGSEAPLTPSQILYQRLLANDRLEAVETIHAQLKDLSMVSFIEEVAIPSLLIAEEDRQGKRISNEHLASMAEEFSEVLDAVFVTDADIPGSTESDELLLVPGPGPLNFAATVALSASLSSSGDDHRMLGETAASPLNSDARSFENAALVCLCFLTEPSPERVEYFKRRMKGKIGADRLVIAFWTSFIADGVVRPQAGVLCEPRIQTATSDARESHVDRPAEIERAASATV